MKTPEFTPSKQVTHMNALQARMKNHGLNTNCGTVPANQPTCSRVGSEERIATYIERHERGEALFHEADINPIHDRSHQNG